MSVVIKEVVSKRDLIKWVRFPTKLYKKNDFFVPFLESDEYETFSPDRNPSYEFCETKLFLAYKDKKCPVSFETGHSRFSYQAATGRK